MNRIPSVTFKTRVRDNSIEGNNPFKCEEKGFGDNTTGDMHGETSPENILKFLKANNSEVI